MSTTSPFLRLGSMAISVALLLGLLGSPGHGDEQPAAKPPVHILKAPAGCFVPDVAVDPRRVVHLIYALDRNAYYVRSRDNGEHFTAPVKVNSEGTVEFKMGERGPKLAVGRDGVIHVAWMDCWEPGAQCRVQYSRSLDDGKTFQPRKTVSSMAGVDGATIAADGLGTVLVFWRAAHPPQIEIPQATWIHLACSTDNGATFAADEHVKVDNMSGLACSMCMMRARIGGDGFAYLGLRGADENLRDFYVLKGLKGENRFTALRVNEDNWILDTCPMCGPELMIAPDGRQLCALMSRHKVYWAVSDPKTTGFTLHVGTPQGQQDEIYPTAVANRRGEVLFVWQVGPMSRTGKATVRWARYTIDGKFTGQQGTAGTTTSGTKATAFVGTDDEFRIVTTAE